LSIYRISSVFYACPAKLEYRAAYLRALFDGFVITTNSKPLL